MILSPSLEILFKHRSMSFEEKIRTVYNLGFKAFEFWSWWDKDMDEIRSITEKLGIGVASMLAKRVTLVDPSRRAEFINGIEESLKAAALIKCPYLIILTGDERPGITREEQLQSVIEGLRAAAPLAETAGITLVLEPLNSLIDHKGYFLNTSEEAAYIIDAVGSVRVKMLFDIYHQQITEGNLIPNITKYFEQIGYFHIADHPGRHEPGTGEINYLNVLDTIGKLGYTGYIGLEYVPASDGEKSLIAIKNAYQ